MTNEPTFSGIAYELALIQFRPQATSEERLNIGVAAVDVENKVFEFRLTNRWGRAKALYPMIQGLSFRKLTRSIEERCKLVSNEICSDQLGLFGVPSLDEIGKKIIPSGSSNFTWSSVRYGVCDDLRDRVNDVFYEYVGRMEESHERTRIDEEGLWSLFVRSADVQSIASQIDNEKELSTNLYSYRFRGSWMNGHLQLAEPISFDYQNPSEMPSKAVTWRGRIDELGKAHDFELVALVTNRPEDERANQYDKAIELLRTTARVRAIIPADSPGQLAELVEHDLKSSER